MAPTLLTGSSLAVMLVGLVAVACDTGVTTRVDADRDHDGYSANAGDCNEQSSDIHPGATELCNGVDDDCNGTIDDGCPHLGDGLVTAGEECDDGNANDGDGCSQAGIVESGWTCNADEPSTCVRACANGEQDQNESDVDCGGVCGATCGLGAACANVGDCASAVCADTVCAAYGAPVALMFRGQPSSALGGGLIAPAITVAVVDALGNAVTNSVIDVTLALAANLGDGTLSGTVVATVMGGIATFADLSIDRAGTGYTLVASADGIAEATSNAFDISVGDATQLAFILQPSSAPSTELIAPAIEVVVLDAGGNLVSDFTASITLAIDNNPGVGSLSGSATTLAVDGVATFDDLSIDKAGTGYTLVASADGIAEATSNAFDISVGSAAQLAFIVQPSNTTSTEIIAPAIEIAVLDAGGNFVTSSNADITIAIGTDTVGGVLTGTITVSAASGVAAFTDLSIDKAGTGYTLVATADSLTGAMSEAFDVDVGLATHLAFVVEPSDTASTEIIAPAIEVAVLDAGGNLVSDSTASIALAIDNNPGVGSLSGSVTTLAVDGVATFDDLAIDKAGSGYTLVASAGGITDATSGAFDIGIGPATHLAFIVQPSNTTSTEIVAPAVEVAVLDDGGNIVTDSTLDVTFSIGTNAGGGTLSGTTTVTATAGVASFSDLNIDEAGTGYTLVASANGLTGVTSEAFDVTVGEASQLVFVAQPSDSFARMVIAPALQVALLDAGGNLVTTSTADVTLAIGTNPAGGALSGTTTKAAVGGIATFSDLVITAAAAGYTLVATSPGVSSATSAGFDIELLEVEFADVSRAVDESVGAMSLTVTLTRAVSFPVTMNFAVSGTATRPEDHGLADGSVIILAGDTSATIDFVVYDDPLPEGDEWLGVALTGGNVPLGVLSATRITIRDNETSQSGLTVEQVAAGFAHTCAIVSGALKCWGDNTSGQLGDGSGIQRTTAVDVSGMASGVSAVSAGWQHTCAIKDEALKCWGNNGRGQLGDGTTTTRVTPVDVSGMASGITAVAAGREHTCATASGAVKCWGYNFYSQLGDGTTTNRVTPVDVSGMASGTTAVGTSYYHTCAIMSGALKCWGSNSSGQLGDGSTTDSSTPVDVNGMDSNVSALAVGYGYTCAVAGGALKCWGRNFYGQIGDGTTTNRVTPVDVSGMGADVTAVAAGGNHTCAIVSGTLKCWGRATNGEVGDASTDLRTTPVNVRGLSGEVTAVATGYSHTCAIAGGALKCWGENAYGQVGDGSRTRSSTPGSVKGIASGMTEIATGLRHTCVIVGGALKCWGDNFYGQLGDGSTTQRATPVDVTGLVSDVTGVAAGFGHTCAIVGGTLKCWGNNGNGQLGDGSTTQRTTPVDVTGLLSDVTGVAAGSGHTCAIVAGAVKCWGRNFDGQLGDGSTMQRTIPVEVSGLGGDATAVAAGEDHTCAVVGGTLKCWGLNNYGQLGNGTLASRSTPVDVAGMNTNVTAIATGYNHTCGVANAALKCWGRNATGQIGNGTLVSRSLPVDVSGMASGVAAVTAGWGHTCAITGGALKCWGYNSLGQLGDGSRTNRATPVDVAGMAPDVTAVVAGYDHTCAIASGEVKCWGSDLYGQLGISVAAWLPHDVLDIYAP